MKIIQVTLEEYKKKMEIKNNKRKTVMGIIRRVYENYYEDFKIFNSGNNSLYLIKYLSKPYNEFSEVSFRSDLDTITDKINKLSNTLKNEDINNSVKISYAYFSKKELKLATNIKKAFKDQINDIIELKDEKIVACSEDNSIKIFDKDGNCLFILNGHLSGVRALCLLRNERFASGSADKTIRIWSLKQHKTIKILKDQSNPIIALAALSGDKLASCSFREILVYDDHFAVKYKLVEHQNWVRGFISLDKERYSSCSDDGLIKIYDKHFRTLYNLKEHNESVMCVCALRDGRIVSGDKSGKIILWFKNFSNNKEIKEHTDAVMHIIQLKDGRVVSCSADKTIKIWDLDFRCLTTFKDHKGCVNRLISLRDGGFGSAGADSMLNIWR
jgi:WD40 repeat protein